jgi:hypothetical protein
MVAVRTCKEEVLLAPKNVGSQVLYSNRYLKNTVIPRYTNNRFTSFRSYEMHKLIPVFQFTSQFSNRSLFPSGSNGKLIFVLRVFALRAVFGGTD